jgi:hypothetical protein
MFLIAYAKELDGEIAFPSGLTGWIPLKVTKGVETGGLEIVRSESLQ